MKRKLSLILVLVCVLTSSSQAQDKKMTMPMMDAMAAKKKLMEPEMMKATEKAMMSDQSMVPAMMAKEMIMHDMMKDEKAMAMMTKTTTAPAGDKPGANKPMMMDEAKMKMAGEKMMTDPQLQLLFQELIARYLVAQKMAMMSKTPSGGKPMTMAMPKMDEKAVMDGKKEMMAGDGMAMMMTKEILISALMKDPEVKSMVEKQAKLLQESALAKSMADESMKMKSEAMTKDPGMMKDIMKDTMMRMNMEKDKKMMTDKK